MNYEKSRKEISSGNLLLDFHGSILADSLSGSVLMLNFFILICIFLFSNPLERKGFFSFCTGIRFSILRICQSRFASRFTMILSATRALSFFPKETPGWRSGRFQLLWLKRKKKGNLWKSAAWLPWLYLNRRLLISLENARIVLALSQVSLISFFQTAKKTSPRPPSKAASLTVVSDEGMRIRNKG